MSKNTNIEMQVAEACKQNRAFDRILAFCEGGIESWIDKINMENEVPQIIPKAPRRPEYTTLSLLLPVVPISPNEKDLLENYLGEKYLNGKEKRVGGDFFRLRKCIFKNNYKLTSHYCNCDI